MYSGGPLNTCKRALGFNRAQYLTFLIFVDPLDQWFSTFFSSRHTKNEKKNCGTLIPGFFGKRHRKSDKLPKKNVLIVPKRVVKERTKKLAAHLEGAHGTPVEKHRSRSMIYFSSFNCIFFRTSMYPYVQLL